MEGPLYLTTSSVVRLFAVAVSALPDRWPDAQFRCVQMGIRGKRLRPHLDDSAGDRDRDRCLSAPRLEPKSAAKIEPSLSPHPRNTEERLVPAYAGAGGLDFAYAQGSLVEGLAEVADVDLVLVWEDRRRP